MKKTFLLLLLLIIIPLASAKSGHLTLLTISSQNETVGGTADLFLDIKPGEGAIFIDSLPLTKLDTQISTRFANEVACKFLETDCSKYDFFYKIRADAAIVGGPSAGAAITILTVSTLGDIPLDEDVVITGTINSGGFIGPVAGIQKKALAAEKAGFKKILVPEVYIPTNESNQTNLTIDVVKVISLEEALEHFTGKRFEQKPGEIIVSEQYKTVMEQVAKKLCNRTLTLNETVPEEDSGDYNYTQKRYGFALEALEKDDHYSAASYCYSSNLILRKLKLQNYSNAELRMLYNKIELAIGNLNKKIEQKEMKTISDLETYMVVKERLTEAVDYLKTQDKTNLSYVAVAYAYERYYSAVAWSSFFSMKGPVFELEEEHLKEACLRKISEAEERLNYVDLYLPNVMINAKKELGYAFEDYKRTDYELCIFKASKAKAEAEAWLTSLVVPEEQLLTVIDHKLEAARKIIVKQQKQNLFPIIGYSYYEYSTNLKETNPYSALTFVEYAVELSSLDNYFPEKKGFEFDFFRAWDLRLLLVFFAGIGTGIIVSVIVVLGRKKRTNTSHKTARPTRT